jgi:hypothetical protein
VAFDYWVVGLVLQGDGTWAADFEVDGQAYRLNRMSEVIDFGARRGWRLHSITDFTSQGTTMIVYFTFERSAP